MKGSNNFEAAIAAFLNEEQKVNEELAIALQDESKSIAKCCDYIIQEVRKQNVSVMTNEEVFSLANKYYFSKEETIIKKVNCRVVVTGVPGIVPPIKDNKTENNTKPKKTANKQSNATQLSIFDLIS
ncbi:Cas9 inhibitor AcrIIA9 family protein [Chryseobacterium oncorhynchi]|uniref:PcfK-like protein n=1 Tax=Chryseobacterium oncorhynchi TaxID=741074 RepID=A0A316WEU1_9FLAO|nr:Cas9 inhibitor AcrIIA9 family protein [Chryseobacterium oncorhynchi]PWN59955.1 hypothetical protein C1638_020525 [Chryseobacterium oncorhynchi]